MRHFQNSIKMKKIIKSVCIFYHIKSISEPGVTAVQLNTAKHEFQPLKHDAWSSSFASSSGIMTYLLLTVEVTKNICRAVNL